MDKILKDIKPSIVREYEQRMAVARLSGWKEVARRQGMLSGIPPRTRYISFIPEYHENLSAIHAAEKYLTYEQAELYEEELTDICKKANELEENPLPGKFAVIHAPAHLRVEAFLKTLDSWEEPINEI